MINENEKNDKILNFNIIVGNQNNNVANEFLSLSNWNVPEAVNLYLYYNSNPNNSNINNQNNFPIFNYITQYSFTTNGILNKFSSLIKLPFLKNNEECCKTFINRIKNLVKTGQGFSNLLRTNKGVIILYNKDTVNKLLQELEIINNDNSQNNNYLNSVIFFPIIDDSIEGKNLVKDLRINRFPCYLFCKYKSNDKFYIIDKMEGIFFLPTFKSTLFPQINNSNINNKNININNDKEKKINIQKKDNNNINNNNINNNIKNNNKEHPLVNNKISNNSFKINNNNEIPLKKEIIKKENKNNNEFSLLNNNNNQKSQANDDHKDKEKDNNNININPNDNNNKNIIKNNNSQINPSKPKKEYIPDYRDYEFDDNNQINSNDFNLNQHQNKFQFPSFSDFNLNMNEPNLSDREIRNYQDNEMKQLERMEQEKEKKERKEKEEKRKEEEAKKKREEKLKEDKEIFSKLIPPEPDDDNPDKCIIIFRLPDGEKNIQRKFLKSDKISVLYDYVRSLGKEIYSEEEYNNFSIIQSFPFKNFENKINNTLEQEGLFPNAVLQIKENE